MKRVMQNSFLVNKIGNLGDQMPEHVKKAIDEISLEADHFKGDISKCPVTKLKRLVGMGRYYSQITMHSSPCFSLLFLQLWRYLTTRNFNLQSL